MRTNKFSIGGLIGVHVSNIIYEVIRTILSWSIYLRKNFERKKRHQNAKQTIVPLLEFLVAFVVFCSLFCVFVGWFWFNLHFCTLKIFS